MISFFISMFFKKLIPKMSLLMKLLFELLSVALTLGVIYFASESFNFKNVGTDSNSVPMLIFLLIGELALIVPMSYAEKFLTNFIELKNTQFYQTLIGLGISPIRFTLNKSLIDSIFPVLRVIISLFVSVIIFKLEFTFTNIFLFSLLQIFSVVIFANVALISSLIYLRFNKGISLFYTLQSFAVILGGAYFPINVFPKVIKNFSSFLPQTQIIHVSRMLFQGVSPGYNPLAILGAWLLFLTLIWLLSYAYIISWLKRNARFF